MGVGWDHCYNLRYERHEGYVLVSDGAGRTDRLDLQTEGKYSSPHLNRVAEIDENGHMTVRFPDLLVWNLEPDGPQSSTGRITSILDRNGNALHFGYDQGGRLDNVTDPEGRAFEVQYDSKGLLSAVHGPAGRSVQYTYAEVEYTGDDSPSSGWNLVAATTPAISGTPNGNDFPNGLTTYLDYDFTQPHPALQHNLIAITDATGTVTSVFDFEDVLDSGDEQFDRLSSIQNPTLGGTLQVILASSQPSQFGPGPARTVITNDGVGNVTEYDFDAQNRLIARRDFTGRANPSLPTTATTNRPTGKLRSSDPSYFETTWTWNTISRVSLLAHPNGNIERNVYEIDLDPSAGPLSRGNLREAWREPGTHFPIGAQPYLLDKYEYSAQFGGCCGGKFVTKHTDAAGFETFYSYDSRGNLTQRVTATDGATTNYIYDAFGRLVSTVHPPDGDGDRREDVRTYHVGGPGSGLLAAEIIDVTGLALTTTRNYDAWGNVIEEIDPNGNSVLSTFNSLGYVVQQRFPLQLRPNGSSYRVRRDFAYDAALRPISVTVDNLDEDGNVRTPARLTTTFQYNGAGLLARLTMDDGSGGTVETTYVHDAEGNTILVRKGEAVVGAQPDNEVAFEYDERQLPFRVILAPSSSTPSTSQKDYDGNGNLVRLSSGIEAGARVTTSVFDAYDREISSTDPLGTGTTLALDERANVLHRTVVGASQSGGGGPVRLSESWSTFDGRGRMTHSIVAHFDDAQASIGDGFRTTSWVFALNSDMLSTTNDLGGTTAFLYDSAGRRVGVDLPSGGNERMTLDAKGNLLVKVETEVDQTNGSSQAFTTLQTFDSRNRLTSITDNAGQTKTFGFDSVDNLVLEIDGRGNQTRHVRDGLKRLLRTERRMTSTGTGAGSPTATIVVAMEWDRSGRLLAQTDGEGNETRYAYNALDRTIARRKADGTLDQIGWGATWSLASATPNLSNFTSGLDAHGDALSLTLATGTFVSTVFDAASQPIARTVTPGTGVSSQTTQEFFVHDGLSRMVVAADDDSVAQFAWDSLGNLTRDTVNGLTNTASYDSLGNQVSLTTAAGRSVSNVWDAASRLISISSGGQVGASYQYVGPHRISRRDYGNGTWTIDAYDADRRITGITSFAPIGGSPVKIDEQAFLWDAADNKLVWADLLGNGPMRAMYYDSADRLVGAQDISGAWTLYSLDLAGNITQALGGANPGAYTLDATLPSPADKQVNQYTLAPTGARTYDQAGATTAMVNAGRSLQLVYDYRSRLVSAVDPQVGFSETYKYDALGRRFERSVIVAQNVTVHTYGHLEQRIVAEATVINGSFVRIAEYAHGVKPDEIVCMWVNGAQIFYHTDDLYDVTCLTNASGAVIERYSYSLFGSPTITDSTGYVLNESLVGNTAMFQSLRFDAGTGLYQNRARYYDPSIGRFISHDPMGDFFDARGFGNGMTRAGNNPWSLMDPTGHQHRMPSEMEPSLGIPGAVLAIGGGVVAIVGVAVSAPFLPILGGVMAIYGGVFGLLDILLDLTWCKYLVSRTGTNGPTMGDPYCVPCPTKWKGKCVNDKLKVWEWNGDPVRNDANDGHEADEAPVQFTRDKGQTVCTDDCSGMVLSMYSIDTTASDSTGGKQQTGDHTVRETGKSTDRSTQDLGQPKGR